MAQDKGVYERVIRQYSAFVTTQVGMPYSYYDETIAA